MNLAILLIASAVSNPAASTVCKKLEADFVANEKSYAFWYDINSTILEMALKYRASLAPAELELALSEGVLGRAPRPRSGTDDVRKARAALDETDVKYKDEGDRITTLLIANKCAPPDHVTSWTTYAKKETEAAK